MKFILKGDLDDKIVDRVIHLTMTKLCPIAAMLGEIAEPKWGYELIKEDKPRTTRNS